MEDIRLQSANKISEIIFLSFIFSYAQHTIVKSPLCKSGEESPRTVYCITVQIQIAMAAHIISIVILVSFAGYVLYEIVKLYVDAVSYNFTPISGDPHHQEEVHHTRVLNSFSEVTLGYCTLDGIVVM